ncbi:MAG: universal stress protein, partial [Nitrosopumilaceae archaeon]|nr:universal stress protein [Nitrosopumilaceae archaeon]
MTKNLRHGDGLSLNTLKKRVSKKARTILIPMDGSENSFRVLRYAIRRAEGYSDRLVGTYVIPQIISQNSKEIKKKFKKNGEKILNKAKNQCQAHNIDFSSKI